MIQSMVFVPTRSSYLQNTTMFRRLKSLNTLLSLNLGTCTVLCYAGTINCDGNVQIQCTILSKYNLLYYQGTMYYIIRVQCILSGYNVLYYQSTIYYTIRVQCTILSGHNVIYYQGTMYHTIRVEFTLRSEYNVLYY